MNKNLIADALTDIDEQFIAEARTDPVKPARRSSVRHLMSAVACACACAIFLCIYLPIAFSHSNDFAAPPQADTGTPPETATGAPPSSVMPPVTDNDASSGETMKPYIEEGYASNDASEPISPLMMAYKIDREFDEAAENLSIQLSFGAFQLINVADWGLTKVAISVWNPDSGEAFVLKELTEEEFLSPVYDVQIKRTIEENEEGELVTTSETRIFQNAEVFSFPSSTCNKNTGILVFNIFAYDGDESIGGSGVEAYYAKSNGKINFLTWREYKDLER